MPIFFRLALRGHVSLFCAEIVATNFLSTAIELSLSVHLDADYADIYEVRVMRRNARGSMLKSQVSGAEIIVGYQGLDHRPGDPRDKD